MQVATIQTMEALPQLGCSGIDGASTICTWWIRTSKCRCTCICTWLQRCWSKVDSPSRCTQFSAVEPQQRPIYNYWHASSNTSRSSWGTNAGRFSLVSPRAPSRCNACNGDIAHKVTKCCSFCPAVIAVYAVLHAHVAPAYSYRL